MSSWVVIPCLTALRNEFNQISPNRDKGSDGTIGDQNHTSTSDHTPDEDSDALRNKDSDTKNEVHALDIDSTGPWPSGRSFKSIVMDIIAGEKKKWLSATDKCRLNYVIFDRKIYDKDNDFNAATYTGTDPHTGHAHFSARYETSCENDTRPWGVAPIPPASVEEDMPTAAEVVDEFARQLADPNSALAVNMKRIGWQYVGGGIPTGKSTLNVLNDTFVAQTEIQADIEAIKAQLDILNPGPTPPPTNPPS